MRRLIFLFLLASSALGEPVISSISPTSGPTEGGTEVLIHGSGFNTNCGIVSPCTPTPPVVYFNGTPAVTEMLSETLIRAITPKYLPLSVEVTVHQRDGIAYAPTRFTFVGDRPSSLERILLPIYSNPVRGAFGSEFHTMFRAWNKDDFETISIIGVMRNCPTCLPRYIDVPWELRPNDNEITNADTLPNGSPGAFIYVRKEHAQHLVLNVRVQDVTRDAQNFGTEIPVVREKDFFTQQNIALLGVPTDPRFRSTLRIYSPHAAAVEVRIGDGDSREVFLTPGENAFRPAYAQIGDFPVDVGTIRVLVLPRGENPPPIWAFISVTNNDTQMITTITP